MPRPLLVVLALRRLLAQRRRGDEPANLRRRELPGVPPLAAGREVVARGRRRLGQQLLSGIHEVVSYVTSHASASMTVTLSATERSGSELRVCNLFHAEHWQKLMFLAQHESAPRAHWPACPLTMRNSARCG